MQLWLVFLPWSCRQDYSLLCNNLMHEYNYEPYSYLQFGLRNYRILSNQQLLSEMKLRKCWLMVLSFLIISCWCAHELKFSNPVDILLSVCYFIYLLQGKQLIQLDIYYFSFMVVACQITLKTQWRIILSHDNYSKLKVKNKGTIFYLSYPNFIILINFLLLYVKLLFITC